MVDRATTAYGASVLQVQQNLEQQKEALQRAREMTSGAQLQIPRSQLTPQTRVERRELPQKFEKAKTEALTVISGEEQQLKEAEKQFEPIRKEYELYEAQQAQLERQRNARKVYQKPKQTSSPPISKENLEVLNKAIAEGRSKVPTEAQAKLLGVTINKSAQNAQDNLDVIQRAVAEGRSEIPSVKLLNQLGIDIARQQVKPTTRLSIETLQKNLDASARGDTKADRLLDNNLIVQVTPEQYNNLVVMRDAGSPQPTYLLKNYNFEEVAGKDPQFISPIDKAIKTVAPFFVPGEVKPITTNVLDLQRTSMDKIKVDPSKLKILDYAISQKTQEVKNIVGLGGIAVGAGIKVGSEIGKAVSPFISPGEAKPTTNVLDLQRTSIDKLQLGKIEGPRLLDYAISQQVQKTKNIIDFGKTVGGVAIKGAQKSLPFLQFGLQKPIEEAKTLIRTGGMGIVAAQEIGERAGSFILRDVSQKARIIKGATDIVWTGGKEIGRRTTPFILMDIGAKVKRLKSAGELTASVVSTGIKATSEVAPYVSYFTAQQLIQPIQTARTGAASILAGGQAIAPYVTYGIGREITPVQNLYSGIVGGVKLGGEATAPYMNYWASQKIEQAKKVGIGVGAGVGVGIKVGSEIGKVIGGIVQARETEYTTLEPIGREIDKLLSEFYSATTKEEQLDIQAKLKRDYGVDVTPRNDKGLGGEAYWNVKTPEWYNELRPGFQEKTQKEAIVPFFFRKLGLGVEQATGSIFQKYAYKDQSFFGEELTPTSKMVGKGVSLGFELGTLYAVPGAAAVRFLGGTGEALTRGPSNFVSFAKEEPFEVIGAGVYTAAKGYQLLKYARQPTQITRVVIKPKETLTERGILKGVVKGEEKPEWFFKYAVQQKFGKGFVVSYQQPRYTTWLEKIGLRKVIGKEQLIGMLPSQLKKQGVTAVAKAFQPRTRITVSDWINVKKPSHYAREVGRGIKPKLYTVVLEKPKTGLIGAGGYIKQISPKAVFVKSARIKPTTINIDTTKRLIKIDIPTPKYSKYVLFPKTRELKAFETDYARFVKETIDVKARARGSIKFTSGISGIGKERKIKGIIGIIKEPEAKVKVFDISAKQSQAQAREGKQILEGLIKPTKQPWLEPKATPVTTPVITSSKQVIRLVEQVKQIPRAVPTSTISVPKVIETTATKSITKELMLGAYGVKSLFDVGVKGAQVPKFITSTATQELAKEIPKEDQLPKVLTSEGISYGSAQPQAQQLIQIPVQIPVQIPTQIPVQVPRGEVGSPGPGGSTPIPQYAFGFPLSPRRKKVIQLKKRKEKPTKLIPFGRRYGKFKPIGEPTTYERAKAKGFEFLRKSLGATFEVRTTKGERVAIPITTREFRLGKKGKDIFQVVQVRGARLSSIGEKREIISTRKAGRIKFI